MPEPAFSAGFIKIKDIRRAFDDSKLKKFIIIFFIWHLGVNIATPFFMLRLLRDIGAAYVWVPILAIGTAVVTIFTLKVWGLFSDKYGHRVIIVISSFFASFIPLLWIFAPSPEYILLIEMFAGFAWAGFSLAHFNYLLEISPPDKRPVFSSLFWIVFGLGGIIGPLLGAAIAKSYVAQSFVGLTGLEVVFFASWILRTIAVIMFILFLEEITARRAKHGASYVFSEMMKFGLHSSRHVISSMKYAASYKLKSFEEEVKEKVGEKVAIAGIKARMAEREAERKLENVSRELDEIVKDIIKGAERIEKDVEEKADDQGKQKGEFQYRYKRKKKRSC
jgi:MFS family permease